MITGFTSHDFWINLFPANIKVCITTCMHKNRKKYDASNTLLLSYS